MKYLTSDTGERVLEYHEAANLFPMMDAGRLRELANDIAKNGQHEPIKLYEGKILDGRNRYVACKAAGELAKYEEVEGEIDPWAYVWSLNGERRQLTHYQRVYIGRKCLEKSEEMRAKIAKLHEEANAKRAETAKAREREAVASGKTVFKSQVVGVTPPRLEPARQSTQRARELEAEVLGTNQWAVRDMDRIKKHSRDLYDRVGTGEMSTNEAFKIVNKERAVAKLTNSQILQEKEARNEFDVIVIHPPWPPVRGESKEVTMTEAELRELKLPAVEGAHIFVVCPVAFQPMAFRLMNKWNINHRNLFVISSTKALSLQKEESAEPANQAEFIAHGNFAKFGHFIPRLPFPQVLTSTAGPKQHDRFHCFYELLTEVTAGRRLTMFDQTPRPGFHRIDKAGNQHPEGE